MIIENTYGSSIVVMGILIACGSHLCGDYADLVREFRSKRVEWIHPNGDYSPQNFGRGPTLRVFYMKN